MVKKSRKAENRKLTNVQAAKITKRIRENRELHNIPAPSAGTSFSHIKNKHKRSQMVSLMKREQKKQKSKVRRARREAEARGEEVERKEPRSIDKMREPDETIVPPDDSEVEDDEHVIPNTFYYPRKEFTFKKICKEAGERGFTDIILFHEKAKQVQGMYICHLPNGPTSYWRLTRLKLGQEMKGSATCNATHNPELILNNFVTRLGRRVGRQLLALFPQKPDFVGRRTVTFHNQRDFVFFRHYRYVFKDDGSKCRLQEIGPRFTLKCKYVQHGTFNSKAGEYEYIWRPDSQVSRKRFFI
jgi:ribosome production factor 1